MTVRVGLLLEAEGRDANTLLDGVERKLREVGGEAANAEAKARRLGPAIGLVGGQGRAIGDVADQTQKLGAETKIAAGSVGNLFAQFNDIGVMMAAGQNPLQLGIQQGTQISQVLGPLGAAGSAKALGGALLALVSPINLITIGGIALGATAFSWITGLISDTEEAVDGMEALEQAVSDYAASVDAINSPLAGANTELQGIAATFRDLQQLQSDLLRGIAVDQLRSQVSALRTDAGGQIFQDAAVFNAPVREGFNSGAGFQRSQQRQARDRTSSAFGIDREEAAQLLTALDALQDAKIPEDVIRSGADLADVLERVFGEADNIPDALRDVALTAAQLSEEAFKLEEAAAEARVGLFDRMMSAVDDYGDRWFGVYDLIAEQQLAAEERQAAEDARQLDALERRISAVLDAEEAGQRLLADLTAQADMQALIAEYGEDSGQVLIAQLQTARDIQDQFLDTLGVSDDLRASLMDAWDAANQVASVDMEGNILSAVNAAGQLVQRLWGAAAAANAVAALQSGAVGPDAAVEQVRNTLTPEGLNRDDIVFQRTFNSGRRATRRRGRSGGGGGGRGSVGGASSVDREREAVTDLIASLEQELEVLRETDPIKQEMIKLRERLGAATEAETQAIEELIRKREEEKAAIEANQDAYDLLKDGIGDFLFALDGTVDGTIQALGDLTTKILEAVAAAYLLGDGPLAGILGTEGTGGFIGNLLGGAFPGVQRKDGGMIYGPGGPRDDKVLTWTSNGEYVVNAEATARNRTLLEMINAGMELPGFRDGGLVGGGRSASPAYMGGDIIIEDHTTGEKTYEKRESVDAAGRRQQRLVIADAVGDGLSVPGGRAKRVMQSGFGLTEVMPRR